MSSTPDAEVVIVGAGVMGLATARALARAGRDVVVCEQFEVGHERGSSHGGSRIVRLSYPDERWVRLAQEAYPLWRELEAECGRALLEQHGTLDLGDWQPNRDALAACGVPFEVLDAAEIERRFPIRVEPGERGLFQADGGIVFADLALQALRDSAEAAGADVRERLPVDSVEEDGDGVVAGGVRARVAVVTAGAWAPALVGVDATPTRETASYFSLDEPVPSVIDSGPGGTAGYALARARDRAEGGAAPVRPGGRPERAGRARSGARRADGGLGGAAVPGAGPRVANGDVPLHEATERRVPARAQRPDRRRLAVQRPRLQVRAGRREAARRAGRGSPLAEEVALGRDQRGRGRCPRRAGRARARPRPGLPSRLAQHELGRAGELVRDGDLRSPAARSRPVALRRAGRAAASGRRPRARRRSSPAGRAGRTSR